VQLPLSPNVIAPPGQLICGISSGVISRKGTSESVPCRVEACGRTGLVHWTSQIPRLRNAQLKVWQRWDTASYAAAVERNEVSDSKLPDTINLTEVLQCPAQHLDTEIAKVLAQPLVQASEAQLTPSTVLHLEQIEKLCTPIAEISEAAHNKIKPAAKVAHAAVVQCTSVAAEEKDYYELQLSEACCC
jgi:hypothetical protein